MPTLPGCVTYGETVDTAIAMAKEAIELYVEDLQEGGEDIPTEEGLLNIRSPSKPMPRIPALTPQKVIKILEKKGFALSRVKGSHHLFSSGDQAPDRRLDAWAGPPYRDPAYRSSSRPALSGKSLKVSCETRAGSGLGWEIVTAFNDPCSSPGSSRRRRMMPLLPALEGGRNRLIKR